MQELTIFNTASRQLEVFHPQQPGQVSFYQCGPTVYWNQHIGNMRAMVQADLIRRTLLYLGYQVKFVRNYTDVGHLTGDNIGDADSGEDRMAKGAKREGLSPDEIAAKYIKQFEADCTLLNILPPDVKPRATEYVPEMIAMVEALLDKGFAYATPMAVYFDVSKAQDYTRLSGQKLELNQVGAGQGDVSDAAKKHPQDFALWFFKTGAHENALQTWPSPFNSPQVKNGEGFPGWHIECSAMARKELGLTLDLHMGGIEHIPVHHTNEIAQSEAANGVKFVNYWLHNEWLMYEAKKLAKSEGTAYLVGDVAAKGYSPLALRYFYLGAHYRSRQNFTWEAIQAAQTAYDKLVSQLRIYTKQATKQGSVLEIWRLKFIEALAADFNLPKAVAIIWELVKSEAEAEDKLETIYDFDTVLGLNLRQTAEVEKQEIQLAQEQRQKIELLVRQREQARAAKDWIKADKIRDTLKQDFQVEVLDGADGASWRVVD